MNQDLLNEDGRHNGVATTTDILPSPLHVADLMTGQFSLGINQIFRFPKSK